MHQPFYQDPITRVATMPWVRLHGTKDYRDLAWVHQQVPSARATVNWVPSLMQQLADAANLDHRDAFLSVALKDASSLTDDDVAYLRQHFFSIHQPTLLEPHAGYRAIRDKVTADKPLTEAERRDLQVWHTLAWCGHVVRSETVAQRLFAQGSNFSEADKHALHEAICHGLADLPDVWGALARSGSVELSTTPYAHPILPLLLDTHAATAADPATPLPARRLHAPGDAAAHVRAGLAAHTETFGTPAIGMWPAEGAVSPAALQVFAAAGVQWLATDEALLDKSLGRRATASERLSPWEFEGVKLVYRDHDLSDRIGFVYADWQPERAYADFADAVANRRDALGGTERDGVLLVALDGENCWERYPSGIAGFLPGLYKAIEALSGVELATISSALARVPARPLPAMATGSWIDGTLRTWIGDPVKNRGWDLLSDARAAVHAHYADFSAIEAGDPELAQLLLAAESSDWWWWFGEGHSSPYDSAFDHLFRRHLQAIYQRIGEPVPDALRSPLAQPTPALREAPCETFSPAVDGHSAWFFKWHGAGVVSPAAGADHRAARLIERLHYTVDADTLYLRVDLGPEPRASLGTHRVELEVDGQRQQLWPGNNTTLCALADVLEVAVPRPLGADVALRLVLVNAHGDAVETFPGATPATVRLTSNAMTGWPRG